MSHILKLRDSIKGITNMRTLSQLSFKYTPHDGWSLETFVALTKFNFHLLFAGFRFDGDYVNRICHISSTNYCAQWRRIGPLPLGVKYMHPLDNKIVSFCLINSQQFCHLTFIWVLLKYCHFRLVKSRMTCFLRTCVYQRFILAAELSLLFENGHLSEDD